MDLQNIQEQLNSEFAKDSTRIVFWFDDKGEYEDEVAELQLDNASLHVLDGLNWLYTKWLLQEKDTKGKYLVYAPFAKPSDARNPLADMYYYSTPYYTDRVSQMSQEVGIDNKFKEHLAQYTNFWKNKNRIEKFKALGIDRYNPETIDLGLIAVLVDVKSYSFEEIVRQLLLTATESYVKNLQDNELYDRFWELCKKYFGYESDKPSLKDLASCLIVTYAAATLKTTVPANMSNYVLKKRNDVVVFVRNIMDNVRYGSAFDELADEVDKTLRFVSKIKADLKNDTSKVQLSDIFACDAFKGFDNIIIDWSLEQLNEEMLDAQIDGLNVAQIADQRITKAFHYGELFRWEYQTVKYAYLLMKAIATIEYPSDAVQLIKKYQQEIYLIDSYYRWFYYAYDKITDKERFAGVRERVENIYANTYLQRITPKWNMNFNDDNLNQLGLIRQEQFYKHYLSNADSRVVVIISDAFRYECAKELMANMELDDRCEARMEAMLGILPTVTNVGMASLLPHNDFSVDGTAKAKINNVSCADLETRDKILKDANANNIAVSFEEIYSANYADIKEKLQGKNLIYIYHNQVDARGDKPASENEVFNACAEAIKEIEEMIRKLTNAISTTKYIVTADHGFLYRRDKLHEFDKVSYKKELCAYSSKRFLITTDKIEEQGIMSRMMAYMDKLYVTTPIGADIFKVGGAGQNYVHGGSSLQELLIPVVDIKTSKGRSTADYVDVILTSASRKVTNLITFFDFIQTEKVTEDKKARNIVAYFATESGEKISFDVQIIANSREDAPEKRTFHEKFTLKSREYKYGDKYYLYLVDANDSKNILHSYEFMIDIAFVNDFDF